MNTYAPGRIEALKVKHPYPGGWRRGTQPTVAEEAVFGVKPDHNLLVDLARKRLEGAHAMYPDSFERGLKDSGKKEVFDIRSHVVKITWRIPGVTPIIGPNAATKKRKRVYIRAPKELTIDGERHAQASELMEMMGGSRGGFCAFMWLHPEIRRHHVSRKLIYYCVADFTRARAQLWQRKNKRA